jgi:hypothetical protein
MDEKPTSEQKRENRFEQWLAAKNVEFTSPKAKHRYQERVGRFIKVFKLEKPDRVPVILPAGSYPLYYSGITLKEAMNDNNLLCQAYRKFLDDFDSDTFACPGMEPSAKASALIDNLRAMTEAAMEYGVY